MDPTLITVITLAVSAGITYLKTRASDKRTAGAREMLEDVVRRVLNTAGLTLDNVHDRASKACLQALAFFGITGPVAAMLAQEFAEYASAELHERLDGLATNLQALKTAGEGMLGAFAAGPLVLPLDESHFERTKL